MTSEDAIFKKFYLFCANDDYKNAQIMLRDNPVDVMKRVITKQKCGWTCLDQGITWKNQNLIKLLLSYGAETKYFNPTNTGNTKEKWDWYCQYRSTIDVVLVPDSNATPTRVNSALIPTQYNSATSPRGQSTTIPWSQSQGQQPNQAGWNSTEESVNAEAQRLNRVLSSGHGGSHITSKPTALVPQAQVTYTPSPDQQRPSESDAAKRQRAAQMEREREEERLRQESLDKKFGVKVPYIGASHQHQDQYESPSVSGGDNVNHAALEEQRILRSLSNKVPQGMLSPKKSMEQLNEEREAWKRDQERLMNISSYVEEETVVLGSK